jgi:calcium uniporter protein, mitochondrial
LITLHKAAKKSGLDLDEYNTIKRQIAEIEYDLRRLNDPLYKDLPLSTIKSPTYSATEIESSKKLKAFLADSKNLLAGNSKSVDKIIQLLESASKRLKKK